MCTLVSVAYLILTTYSFYDFKLTLFVGTPALAIALYMMQISVQDYERHFNLASDNNEGIVLWTIWGVAVGLFTSISNYNTQKQICELIIEKFTVVKHQREFHSLFMSQPEGILIYHMEETKNDGDSTERQDLVKEQMVEVKLCNDAIQELVSLDSKSIQECQKYKNNMRYKLINPEYENHEFKKNKSGTFVSG